MGVATFQIEPEESIEFEGVSFIADPNSGILVVAISRLIVKLRKQGLEETSPRPTIPERPRDREEAPRPVRPRRPVPTRPISVERPRRTRGEDNA